MLTMRIANTEGIKQTHKQMRELKKTQEQLGRIHW